MERFRVLIFLVLLGLLSGSAAGQEAWQPAYQFHSGQVMTATTILEVTGTYETSSSELPSLDPSPHPAHYSFIMVRRLEVLASDDNSATLREELISIREVLDGTRAISVFEPGQVDKYSPLMPQLGGTARYRVSDQGYTTVMQEAGEARGGFGQLMSGTLFLFPRLPEEPVKPGQEWSPGTRTVRLGAMEGMARVDYSVAAVDMATPEARFDYTRTVTANNLFYRLDKKVESATSVRDFAWTMDQLEMETIGTARLDMATGRLVETESLVQFQSEVRGVGTMYVDPFRLQVKQTGTARNRTLFQYR